MRFWLRPLLAGGLALATLDAQSPEETLREADRLYWLGNLSRAAPLFREAEQAFQRAGRPLDAMYARLGALRWTAEGRPYGETLATLDSLCETPEVQAEPRVRLRCLMVRGGININADPLAAEPDWRAVLSLAQEAQDRRTQAHALEQLAIVAYVQGNANAARGSLLKAISLFQQAGDPIGQTRGQTLIANALQVQGQTEQALALYERVIAAVGKVPDAGFPLRAYIGKAATLGRLGRTEEAERVLTEALRRAEADRVLGAQSDLYSNWAKLAERQGKNTVAGERYRHALRLAQEGGLPRLEASVLSDLAELHLRRKEPIQARQYAAQALAVNETLGDRYQLPQFLTTLGRAAAQAGRAAEAKRAYARALDVLDGLLLHVPNPVTGNALIGTMSRAYVSYAELAIARLHDPRLAWEVVERARGRIEAQQLASQTVGGPYGKATLEWAKGVATLQSRLAQARDPAQRRSLLERLLLLEHGTPGNPTEVVASRTATEVRRVPLRATQAVLRADETLLEYIVGPESAFCLIVKRNGVSAVPLGRSDKLTTAAQNLLAEIAAKRDAVGAAQALYQLALQPATASLSARLIVVPDGPLHGVPFDALRRPDGRLLLETAIVSTTPSARLLGLLRQQKATEAPESLLAIGDVRDSRTETEAGSTREATPETTRGLFDDKGARFRALPHSREEVGTAAQLAGPSARVLAGPDATETAWKAASPERYRILHFAVHGVIDNRSPERSALVLGTSTGEDGLLQPREIRPLPLRADLVVLSSCESASGRVEGQAGVANLPRSFFHAGARAVASTLWAVEDRMTATLMAAFYRRLRAGDDVASALRGAKRDTLAVFGPGLAPYYWAGAIVSGDGATRVRLP